MIASDHGHILGALHPPLDLNTGHPHLPQFPEVACQGHVLQGQGAAVCLVPPAVLQPAGLGTQPPVAAASPDDGGEEALAGVAHAQPPYQQYNSALNRIKLRKHDLNKIKENAISDGINTFVFINNDGSISIETVSRSIIDIQDTLLDSIFLFYPTTIMKMDSKRKIIDIK